MGPGWEGEGWERVVVQGGGGGGEAVGRWGLVRWRVKRGEDGLRGGEEEGEGEGEGGGGGEG